MIKDPNYWCFSTFWKSTPHGSLPNVSLIPHDTSTRELCLKLKRVENLKPQKLTVQNKEKLTNVIMNVAEIFFETDANRR